MRGKQEKREREVKRKKKVPWKRNRNETGKPAHGKEREIKIREN
jgi:hypothetical protein